MFYNQCNSKRALRGSILRSIAFLFAGGVIIHLIRLGA